MTVQLVCRLVAYRSAKLVATGCFAVLDRRGFFRSLERTVIAVDGGMYLKWEHYRRVSWEGLGAVVFPRYGVFRRAGSERPPPRKTQPADVASAALRRTHK